MKIIKIYLVLIYIITSFHNCLSQFPVWPLDNSWNQINCTFAEKHTSFHAALDINLANNNNFRAILDGIMEDDANSSLFMKVRHMFQDSSNIETHLKYVRYGDDADPLPGIVGLNRNSNNPSIVLSSHEIGKSITGGHLHFEMWIRDCVSGCEWYKVNPLDNTHTNYTNLPPNYDDTYDVELNDVIY
jgi:hypothetical protein